MLKLFGQKSIMFHLDINMVVHQICLLKKKGKYILIDFKTSSNVYVDNLIQGSAYAHLIKENDKIEIDKFIVARFPKDDSEYEIREFNKTDLKEAFKQFKEYLIAFERDKELKKRIKKK